MRKDAGLAMVTVFGLGHLRPAPGTWGSMPPVALAGVLIALGLGPGGHPVVYNLVMAAVAVVFTLACAVKGDEAEAVFLRKDPSQVVADETAGQAVTLMFLPAAAVAGPGLAVFTLFYAFIAFRVMDILKPWPAFQIQKIPGGWGVVLDDLMAGVYALIVVQVISRVWLGAW